MRGSFKFPVFLIVAALFLVGGFLAFRNMPGVEILVEGAPPPPPVSPPYVEVGELRIPVDVADENHEITTGLSGRPSLPEERGMFFVFSAPDRYRFWMPDMHFPIDIIWIEDGQVIGIAENVSNEFDPANPKFYLPPVPVRYVLEVNAGFAKAHGITSGTPVSFDLSAN